MNVRGNKILLEKKINGEVSHGWFRTKQGTAFKNGKPLKKHGYIGSCMPIARSLAVLAREGAGGQLEAEDVWNKSHIAKASKAAAERIAAFICSRSTKETEAPDMSKNSQNEINE